MLLSLSLSYTVSSDGKDCLACDFKLPKESINAVKVNPCDDLFRAACEGPDGKSKYLLASQVTPAKLKKAVDDARDKTVQTMGYKDLKDALRKILSQAGFVLKEPLDDSGWQKLMGNDNGSKFFQANSTQIYVSADQCLKDIIQLQSINESNINDVSKLNEQAKKYESLLKKYQLDSVKYHALDLSNFMVAYVGPKCFDPQNQKRFQACSNPVAFKSKAVELYRKQGTKEYASQSEAFVRENLMIEAEPMVSAKRHENVSELELARARMAKLKQSFAQNCHSYSSAMEKTGQKIVQDYLKTLARSKTTIDSLFQSVYPQEKLKLAANIFNTIRADAQDVTTLFIKDPKKREPILIAYDSLNVGGIKKPENSDYIKDKNGNYVLAPTSIIKNPADDLSGIYLDPNLTQFIQTNAFYTPSASFGKTQKLDEQIVVLPGTLDSIEDNPLEFLSVVAHEAGHKIGPKVSVVNGYDMTEEHKDLLNCYKRSDSIKMEVDMGEEVIADFVSSEVLARQIQKLPKENRQQAVLAAMTNLCVNDAPPHFLAYDGEHPYSYLRVNGIFGANPSIRRVLGCTKDSPKFKSCGLKTSILDIREGVAKSAKVNEKQQSDSQEKRGVQ